MKQKRSNSKYFVQMNFSYKNWHRSQTEADLDHSVTCPDSEYSETVNFPGIAVPDFGSAV